MKMMTLFLWLIFLASLLWLVIFVVWFILYSISPSEFYMPPSIRSLSMLLFILICWVIAVTIIFYFCYERSKHIQKAGSGLQKLSEDHTQLHPWAEILPSSLPEEVHFVRQSLLSAEELNCLTSAKILSYGINLANQGMFKEAIGIFRMVIDRPDASPLLVQIAEYRLYQLFSYSPLRGEKLLNKVERG